MTSHEPGKRGFAAAGRAVKDQRAEPTRIEHTTQKLAGAQDMLLAHEIRERDGAHARGQWLDALALLNAIGLKQVDGDKLRPNKKNP